MVPIKQYDNIKLRYKYAAPEQKSFEGFAQILIEIAGWQAY